jgi:hypothetical protein
MYLLPALLFLLLSKYNTIPALPYLPLFSDPMLVIPCIGYNCLTSLDIDNLKAFILIPGMGGFCVFSVKQSLLPSGKSGH